MSAARAMGLAAMLAVLPSACHTAGPAPLRLWVPHSSAEVLRISAAKAADLGFKVTQRDSTRGSLSATRDAAGTGNADYILCSDSANTRGVEGDEYFQSIVAFTVTASDSGGGAAVGIEVSVPDAWAPMFAGNGAMHWRCSSSGGLEKLIAAALGGPGRRVTGP